MAKTHKYHGLASIALLRVSEKDLREIYDTISNMSFGSFSDLIRDIEDEIDNSIHLSLENLKESSVYSVNDNGLYREIDYVRKEVLRVTVQKFAELLHKSLMEVVGHSDEPIPNFDARRGLQQWINRLSRTYDDQKLFQAMALIAENSPRSKKSDWRLK